MLPYHDSKEAEFRVRLRGWGGAHLAADSPCTNGKPQANIKAMVGAWSFSDAVFEVGPYGDEVPAHRVLVAHRCPALRAALGCTDSKAGDDGKDADGGDDDDDGGSDADPVRVVLPNYTVASVRAFLEYLYTGTVTWKRDKGDGTADAPGPDDVPYVAALAVRVVFCLKGWAKCTHTHSCTADGVRLACPAVPLCFPDARRQASGCQACSQPCQQQRHTSNPGCWRWCRRRSWRWCWR